MKRFLVLLAFVGVFLMLFACGNIENNNLSELDSTSQSTVETPDSTSQSTETSTQNSVGGSTSDDSSQKEPPPREYITVHSVEELEKMRQMLDCKDETRFSQYLQSIKCSGQIGRQKLGTFVSIVDKIPYIKIVDGEISWINYSKGISQDTGKEVEVLYVTTKKSDDEWCRIEYYLIIEEVSTLISEDTPLLPTTIKSNDGRIEVFTEKIKNENIISWLVTIDNTVARVVYKTKDAVTVNAQEIYEDLYVSQILTNKPNDKEAPATSTTGSVADSTDSTPPTTDSSTTDSSLNSGSGTTTENSTDSSCGLTDVSSGDTTNDSQDIDSGEEKLTSLMPQWLTEEERELLYNKELYKSKVDIENKAIIKVYNTLTPLSKCTLSLDEIIAWAESIDTITYVVLNENNDKLRICNDENGIRIVVIETSYKGATFAEDLKSLGRTVEIFDEAHSVEAVHCFDDLSSHGGFYAYYVTDGGIFVRYYENAFAEGTWFTESDFAKYGTAYYKHITSYEYNHNENGELLSGSTSLLEYINEIYGTGKDYGAN